MLSFSEYSNEEVERLVKSLDRKEDEFIFSKDVLLTHPHLAEVYTLTCPERCDLATAARKAVSGAYSGDRLLTKLRADLQLMVENCIRFNGESSPLAIIAKRFFTFSTQRINEFIEQHSPSASDFTPFSFAAVRTSDSETNHESASSLSSSRDLTYSAPPTRKKVVDELLLPLRQQNAEFSIDVTEAYPELKEKYVAVCPRVMHLGLMIVKARAGAYTGESEDSFATSTSPRGRIGRGKIGSHHRGSFGGDHARQPSVWGTSIASSLLLLRQDIELIVRNCVVFNANLEKWVHRARQFQRHAHRLIDAFVLKHCPMLKGTVTGEAQYSAAVQADDEEKKRESKKMNSSTSSMQENVTSLGTPSTSWTGLDGASLTDGLGGKRTRQEGASPAVGGFAASTSSDCTPPSTSVLSSSSSAGIRKKTVKWEEEYSSAPLGEDAVLSSTAGTHTGKDSLRMSASAVSPPVKAVLPRVVQIEEEGEKEDGNAGASLSGNEVQWVFPTPVPSVAQPPLAVPSRLRQRIIKDHLSRHALRPRIIGQWMEDECVCRGRRNASMCGSGEEKNRECMAEKDAGHQTAPRVEGGSSGEGDPHVSNRTGMAERTESDLHRESNARNKEWDGVPHTVTTTPLHTTTDFSEEKGRNSTDEKEADGVERRVQKESWMENTTSEGNGGRGSIFLTSAYSAAALLAAFEAHICYIFARQRLDSSAVENAFRYTRQEEQVFLDVIRTIGEQFNRLFLSLLVYESEMIAFRAYAATQRILPWVLLSSPEEGNLQQDGGTAFSFPSSDTPASLQSSTIPLTVLPTSQALTFPAPSSVEGSCRSPSSITNNEGYMPGVQTPHFSLSDGRLCSSYSSFTPMDWLHCVHYSYLIRLVVQFPQLVALSCCVHKREASHDKGGVSGDGESSGVKREDQGIPARGGAKTTHPERVDASTLLFPRSAKGVLAQSRQVTEDLLAFADEYECLLLES